MTAATEYARDLVRGTAPVSVALTRQLVWRMMTVATPADAHRVDSALLLAAATAPDAREGVAAFRERRAPEFPMRVPDDLPGRVSVVGTRRMEHVMAQVPVAEGIFTCPSDEPQLIGSRCTACGIVTFPAQDSCPRCASTEMAEQLLARRGRLWAWTTQDFPPPSPPYSGPTGQATSCRSASATSSFPAR